MTHLTWSEELGKRVRTGDWADQVVPTVTKIGETLRAAAGEIGISAGRLEIAAQLVDYFMEEAKVLYAIYKNWSHGFVAWLDAQGTPPAERDAELGRLARLLAYPDGAPFEPAGRWAELGARAGRLGNRIRGGDIPAEAAIAETDGLLEDWRRLHDRYVDLVSGLLAFVARRYGEPRVEDCYRHVMEPFVRDRYMSFDVRLQPYEETVSRNLYLAIEAMRAHVGGPERRGSMELREHGDRYELRFDPCGSGGRMLRGDPTTGTGSRVLPPYEFGVTRDRHDWAWNEKGVCYYCAHCCLALERMPAERWGHPVRVVDPPVWGGEGAASTVRQCQWTVYKTLAAIPPRAYERIGLRKP